jgi:bacterioferritin
MTCVLRYKRHYFMTQCINASNAASEFLQHSTGEQNHADRIAQLQGEPNFVEGGDPVDMIKADLGAERVAVDILAVEAEHADDLLTLLHPAGMRQPKGGLG